MRDNSAPGPSTEPIRTRSWWRCLLRSDRPPRADIDAILDRYPAWTLASMSSCRAAWTNSSVNLTVPPPYIPEYRLGVKVTVHLTGS